MPTAKGRVIHGSAAPGFEPVRDEFQKNFTTRGEVGAALAVYHRGEKVVDLWVGYRDARSRAPWEEHTMVMVFSTSKGMAAMALAVAHSRGLLDYNEKVAAYWPEFAQNGKEAITVRQLLAHQAGLCAIDDPITRDILANPDRLAAALARQKPLWEPGTRYGYHAISLGWYESELIRRVDPKHRRLGQFFHEEIAVPLGIDFYFGLPQSIPDSRIATLTAVNPLRAAWSMLLRQGPAARRFFADMANPKTLTARSFTNPKEAKDRAKMTERDFLALENPSFTGVGEARAIARAYSCFVCGGREIGIRPETMSELTAPPTPPSQGSMDLVLGADIAFSLGFMRWPPGYTLWSSRSFLSPGNGGSIGGADPDAQVAYAYVMNRMGTQIRDDPRAVALGDALHACLARS